MLTNVVRALCLLVDIAIPAAAAVAAVRHVRELRARRRRPVLAGRPVEDYQGVRVLRSTSPDRPVR